MIRFIATIWSKWSFVFAKEVEAGKHVWAAKVAERNTALTKTLIAQLTKETDAMEVRVKQMIEMEEKGFWECENGHEHSIQCGCASPGDTAIVHVHDCLLSPPVQCSECGKPMTLIKRSEMTGQAQYESDKDRKDAEKLVAARREEIATQTKDLENQEHTAAYFKGQAQSSRMLADNLRKV
jgi:hypothetical protein